MARRVKDVETTKPRQIMLDLSDEDVKDFISFAHENGTTPEEILQGFICDLIDGTQTRGSDERLYAEQYFGRCGYSYLSEGTFTNWALANYYLEDVEATLKEIEIAKENIADSLPGGAGDEGDPDILAESRQELAEAEQYMAELYEKYIEWASWHGGAEDFETAMESAKTYLKRRRDYEEKMEGQEDYQPFIEWEKGKTV